MPTIAMSPEASPNQIGSASGVRRVNNLPIYIAAGIVLTFLLIMALVAMDRSAKQGSGGDEEKKDNRASSMLAEMIVGNAKAQKGIIQPEVVVPIIPNEHKINIEIPENRDLPPVSPIAPAGALNVQNTQDADAQRIRQQKIQLLEKAIQSKTNVDNTTAPRSAASVSSNRSGNNDALARLAEVRRKIAEEENAGSSDPTAAYKLRLAQLKGVGDSGGFGEDYIDDEVDDDTYANNDIDQFNDKGQGDRWSLNSKTKAPHSPYILQTGFVMPATLISGINSQLPGQLSAQVSQDVYDSPIGKHKLIPQGSRLVGAYSSDVVFGQGRLLVAWQRIIFPDGKTRDIGAMPGSSGAGYAGFNDKVNNHYLRIFGSALLMSAVIAGATYSQRDAGGGGFGRQSAGSILSQSLGQQLGRVTTMLMRKNLNIAPTLEIRPGYRFNVVVTKDLVFTKPYQSFDY